MNCHAQGLQEESQRCEARQRVSLADARARRLSKSEAYRCLANRWLGIIWKLWLSRQPYDEDYHLQQILRHRRRRR